MFRPTLSDTPPVADIQAAINALPSGPGRVELPHNGVFTISQSIGLRSDLTLDCNGALIQRAPGFVGDLFNSGSAVSQVKIQDGRFDNGSSFSLGFDIPNGSTEITFRRNRVTGHLGTFFQCASGSAINKNIRVAGNDFFGDTTGTSQNQNSVTVWNPYATRITNNFFEGTGGVTASTSQGAPSTCRHVYVKGNTFKQLNGSAILVRTSGTTTLENIVVSGNTGEQLGDTAHLKGLAVVGEAVVTGAAGTTRRATIYGNTVHDFYGNGISCGGGSDGPTCFDFTIVGNTIDAAPIDAAVDTTRGTTGIQLSGVIDFSIADNTIRNTGRGGIRLLPGSSNVGCKEGSIHDNTIVGCVANPNITAPTPDQEGGILLWDKSTDISIHDNTIKNTTTVQNGGRGISLGAYVGINGIDIHNNRCFDDRATKLQEFGVGIGGAGGDAVQPTDVEVHHNDLRGNLTQGIKAYNTTPKNYNFDHNKGATGLPEAPLNPDPIRRQAVTASTTLATSAELAGVTDNTASRTVTLPLVSAVPIGRVVIVKDETGTAATRAITVAGQGTDTIEGAATKTINTNYGYLRLYSTGTAWVAL